MHIYNRIRRLMSRTDRKLLAALYTILTLTLHELPIELPGWLHVSLLVALGVVSILRKSEEYTAMCTGPHPYIPVPNTAKVELVEAVLGETVENVIHFVNVAGWDSASLLQLAIDVKNAWNDNIKPVQSTSAALVKIRCTDLSSETGPSIEYTAGLPITGNIGNAVTNGAQTVATKFTTAQRGRSYRGRVYNIGIPDNAVTNNRIADDYALQLTLAWEQFRADILAEPLASIMAVVSTCQNNAWLTEGIATAIIGTSTDAYVDSQRRRLHGRGQ